MIINEARKVIESLADVQKKDHSFLLLQINSSVFPLGTYAHSFGFENYISLNKVNDIESTYAYVKAYLLNMVTYSELLPLKIAYQLAQLGDLEGLRNLDKQVTNSTIPSEIKVANRLIARTFIQAINDLKIEEKHPVYQDYVNLIENNHSDSNHSVLYGTICASLDIDLEKAMKNYLFSLVENIISIAVKTIPLGQKAGQYIIVRLFDVMDQVLARAKKTDESLLCLATPGFDLASMQHESGFSRIYMS